MADQFDTLFDNMVAKLRAYSTAQVAALQFNVWADRFRDIPNASGSVNVFVYLGVPMSPQGSESNGMIDYESSIYVDMEVRSSGKEDSGEYTEATEMAGKRLRALILQVMDALFAADWMEAGMPNVTARKELDSVTAMSPEEIGERGIQAARMTIKVGLEWEPTPLSGVALDSILADAEYWSALIEP